MARNLECSTRAKRETLALRVIAMAALHGATLAERHDRKGETYLRFHHGHYAVSMDFDATIEGFMGHWHLVASWEHDSRYPADFGSAIGGPLNTVTYGKASTMEEDFDSFMRSLAAGFTRLSQMGVQPVSQEIAA